MVPDSCSCDTLLFARNDISRQDWEHCAVHGHRHRNLIERNAVEQDLHVLYRIDRNTCFTDISCNARMIRVIPRVLLSQTQPIHLVRPLPALCDKTHLTLLLLKNLRTDESSMGARNTLWLAVRAQKARNLEAYQCN